MSDLQKALEYRQHLADRTVAEAALLKVLKEKHDESRAKIEGLLNRGEKITGRHGGTSLGSVSFSDPKPKGTVTDRALLLGHVAGVAPEQIGLKITDVDAAIAVLEEHAPGLLAPALSAQDEAHWVRRAEAGEPVPGVTVTTGDPRMSIRPSTAGKALMAELLTELPVMQLAIEAAPNE